jgi:hypothetical protein
MKASVSSSASHAVRERYLFSKPISHGSPLTWPKAMTFVPTSGAL